MPASQISLLSTEDFGASKEFTYGTISFTQNDIEPVSNCERHSAIADFRG